MAKRTFLVDEVLTPDIMNSFIQGGEVVQTLDGNSADNVMSQKASADSFVNLSGAQSVPGTKAFNTMSATTATLNTAHIANDRVTNATIDTANITNANANSVVAGTATVNNALHLKKAGFIHAAAGVSSEITVNNVNGALTIKAPSVVFNNTFDPGSTMTIPASKISVTPYSVFGNADNLQDVINYLANVIFTGTESITGLKMKYLTVTNHLGAQDMAIEGETTCRKNINVKGTTNTTVASISNTGVVTAKTFNAVD